MIKNKKRVLVAMSGGVDSSVALIKILEKGYEAIGITLKLWENKDKKTNKVIDSDCNSVDAINGAKLVCDRLGVHHYTLDFIDLFRNHPQLILMQHHTGIKQLHGILIYI